MNKALEEIEEMAKKVPLYKVPVEERSKMFNESFEKINISKTRYIYMKEELDKLRGRVL